MPTINFFQSQNVRHLVRLLMAVGILGAGQGCSILAVSTTQGFHYQDIPVTTESARSGDGATIIFRGHSLPLTGPEIRKGHSLRAVSLTRTDLSLINLAQESPGTVRVISIVPSLDTKVCEQQTHFLSEKHGGLDQRVTLITISVDTPFAQKRFAQEARISNVEFLSDYRGAQFGKTYGLLLEGPHVLARTVMVVDTHNMIRHLQITPDLGHMPDMAEAFRIAGDLLDKES